MGAEVCAAAVEVDGVLAAVADSFDYLLYVSPSNSEEVWQWFSATSYADEPRFRYREVDLDVDGLRRRLEGVRIDAIEDVAVARLLEGKRSELLHHLGLLTERGTSAFLERSIALSGVVEEELAALAEEILTWAQGTAGTEGSASSHGSTVSSQIFAERAEEEIRAYRRQDPSFTASVELRDDINALMVSGDLLLVPEQRRVPQERVEALIHHEVGTHLLTWWNGHVQPLRMLAAGLGGYQETQEGLGVLAELLSGGMAPTRLRELAARVIAARSVIDGATFRETFAHLHDDRGLPARGSFDLADRVHRGGGLVKDAAYLRGLVRLIGHLQHGGHLEPLLVGKFDLDDLADVEALLDRGVLVEPRVRPRWLAEEGELRLARLRAAPDALTVLLG
jgi:uncharacterized protein (TIGR02421 family)